MLIGGFWGDLRVTGAAWAQSGAEQAMRQSLELQEAGVAAMHRSIETQRRSATLHAPRSALEGSPPAGEPLSAGCGKPADLDGTIRAAANREGLDAGLLRAVIRQESAFDPCAVSPKGAMGLMQLMPATAAGLGVADPFDPHENVSAGARFLRTLLDRYKGDLPLALGAYNAGPGRVDAFGAIPPIPETVDYVRKILKLLARDPADASHFPAADH
jgi:soluble lytic murein transglycosylase-like protein